MQGVFRILTAISLLLTPFMAQAQNTQESSAHDPYERRFFSTTRENERGKFLDIAPLDQDDKSIHRRMPSDCPECGLECLMPPLVRFDSSPNATELGAGVVTVTVENPSRCVRMDGFRSKRDSAVLLVVSNLRKEKYQFGVLESGELLIERDVLPGQEFHEQLVPLGDRRYTFSISAYPDRAKELPTQVGFAVYRYENDTDPVQSLVMFNIGAGQ